MIPLCISPQNIQNVCHTEKPNFFFVFIHFSFISLVVCVLFGFIHGVFSEIQTRNFSLFVATCFFPSFCSFFYALRLVRQALTKKCLLTEYSCTENTEYLGPKLFSRYISCCFYGSPLLSAPSKIVILKTEKSLPFISIHVVCVCVYATLPPYDFHL